MEYTIYIDESGTGDKTAKAEDSAMGILSGYMGTTTDWKLFSNDWRAMLQSFDAPYFHFYEHADARGWIKGLKKEARSNYGKNPYRDWTLEKLDGFFNECKKAIRAYKLVPLGAQVETRKLLQAAMMPEYSENALVILFGKTPLNLLVHDFFGMLPSRTIINSGDSIDFIFDQQGDTGWTEMVERIFKLYQKRDKRFKSFRFGDKDVDLPLQAADIPTYRSNQIHRKMRIENLDERRRHLKISDLDVMITEHMPGIPQYIKDRAKESIN